MRKHGPKTKIKEEFEQTWPGAGLEERFAIDYRARIAKRFLSEETDEYQTKLQEEADKDHEERVDAFEKIMSGEELPESVFNDPMLHSM